MVRFLLPDLDLKSVLDKPEVILTDAAEDDTKHLWERRRDLSDHPAPNNRKKKHKKKHKKKRKTSLESQDIIWKEEVVFLHLIR